MQDNQTAKQCRKCGNVKAITEFYSKKDKKKKPYSPCKSCIKASTRKYYSTHRVECQKRNKEWRENHPDLMKKYDEKWRKNNPEKAIQWAKLHPEQMNKIKRKSHKKTYPIKRKEILEKRREYRKRYSRNPKYRLNNTMARSISEVLSGRKNYRHWENLVGYTLEELMAHLSIRFQDGMSFDNYGKWHIDHIVPLSAFNFDTPEQIDFKRCWALKNLQPMWAKDNIQKYNKLSGHFQPMLKISG